MEQLMKSVKLLATALLTASLAGTSWAQNSCGNAATPPKITTSAVVSPGHLEVQGVEYVAGDAVQLQLLTDGCTDIQSIQVGSTTLTPAMTHSGTLPNYYWYNSIDTQNNATGHGYLISVGFPTIVDGSTDELTLTVVRSGGTGTVVYAFPLVHVRYVEPINADSAIGISGAEIHNQFANALHDKFSGPNNSAVMNGTRVDYDPASLGTYIDSTGIWLSFRLKAETTCKPIISVTGTFVLDTNAPDHAGLSVRWVNPANANLETTWCVLAGEALSDIAHWITLGLVGESGSVGSVQQELTQDIMNSLPDTSSANLLLDGTTTHNDELLVNLKIPAPSVEIDVPYDAFDMTRTPMRFPPGQVVGLVANGLGMRDYVAGVSPSPYAVLQSGPNGVPEQTPTTLSNAYTVARTDALVDPPAAVAQLLARFPARGVVVTGPSDFRYTPVCKLTVPAARTALSGPPQILFGVNDTTADAQRLRTSYPSGGYKVRVIFGFAGNACYEYTRPLVNR
jgi:hypothetical protein